LHGRKEMKHYCAVCSIHFISAGSYSEFESNYIFYHVNQREMYHYQLLFQAVRLTIIWNKNKG